MEGLEKSMMKLPVKLKEKYLDESAQAKEILLDSCLANVNRIYYLSLVGIPVTLGHILFFLWKQYENPVEILWQRGLIFSHSIICVALILFFFQSRRLKKYIKPIRRMCFLQYAVMALIVISGLVIVILDQLVTTNITPYIISSVLVGTVLVIRPKVTVIVTLVSYILFFFLMTIQNSTQAILWSSRLNGASAASIAITLSLITWRNFYVNIVQKKRIEQQQSQLAEMAYYDSLTSLPNRRYFDKVIDSEIQAMKSNGHQSSIIIIDIDNFKMVNDTYGHYAGDCVLTMIGEVIRKSVKEFSEKAFVARWGGEEYIVLLSGSTLDDAFYIAEKIRQSIEDAKLESFESIIQVTASLGVSLLSRSEKEKNYSSLADNALYKAKKNGKNRVETA